MTKPVTACMILAAVACSCNGPASTAKPAAGAADRAEEIIEAFREEVRREIYPVYDDLTAKELTQRALKIVSQTVEPNLSVLVAKGKAEYMGLPKADLDLSTYEPALPPKPYEQLQVIVEVWPPTEIPIESEFNNREWAMLFSWNPCDLARRVRTWALVRVEGASAYSRRAVLESFAPAVARRLNDDPGNPVVVLEEPASRVTVVHMGLRDSVLFVPTRIEHLKKK